MPLGLALAVTHRDRDPIKRQGFARRIHAQRDRGTAAQGRIEKIIGRRAAIAAAEVGRFVCAQHVVGGHDMIGIGPLTGLAHHNPAPGVRSRRGGTRVHADIAQCPGRDDIGGMDGIVRIAQQVIGAIEIEIAARMPRRLEQSRRILHPDSIVDRRMRDQQGRLERRDGILERMILKVVEELLADTEGTAGELDPGLPLRLDLGNVGMEGLAHMRGIGRRAQRRNGTHRGQLRRRRDHGCPAQAVPDHQGRRLVLRREKLAGLHQVLDIGGKIGVGEIRLAAWISLEQEKQWANSAKARGVPSGNSSRAARVSPRAPVNSTRSDLAMKFSLSCRQR